MARPPLSRRLRARISLWATLALAAIPANAQAGSLAEPIDPFQQTAFAFPERSHWLQPWRGYLETVPASRLRGAIGINYDPGPGQAPATARLLSASGFSRARIEEAWGSVSYADRSQLENLEEFRSWLVALRDHGIRPLILLNVNHGAPGPTRRFQARLVASAAQGAREVRVDAATANAIVPGRTGLDALNVYKAAEILFTHVAADGTATLSKPLPQPRPAGTYPATTLAYAPFQRPLRSDGSPNPAFEETMAGWLSYVDLVLSEARNTLGSSNFDVEVWNELNFGSNFLSAANYYNPVPPALQGAGSVPDVLLAATVRWLRSPATNLPDVGIGDGFADQTPFVSGATVPAGVTAIDKHPYHESAYSFPQAQAFNGVRPVNAGGVPEGQLDPSGDWHDPSIPSYTAYFPEYTLSGIQTEFMERDLSPITTNVSGVPHGRSVKPPGATQPPQVWITETNVDLSGATGLTAADKWHLQAKATLRSLAAYVNKGVSALYFYAVGDNSWSMVDPSAPGGGATMLAVKNFMQPFAGPATISTPRSLSLSQIADQGNWTQFSGDGTPAHPPLYNRDVVAFLPFQVDDHKFVVPAYVMTRNLATLYNQSAPSTDPTRFDLPPETYRLTVGGLNTANLSVTATDPLTGSSVPVQATPTSATTAVLEVPLTDYPRLLVIQDG